jgi:protein N-terminal asparagine amidohydrolase
VVGPMSLLYVAQREFAVTHPHDSRISILGTDDVTTGIIVILRHTGQPSLYISFIFTLSLWFVT